MDGETDFEMNNEYLLSGSSSYAVFGKHCSYFLNSRKRVVTVAEDSPNVSPGGCCPAGSPEFRSRYFQFSVEEYQASCLQIYRLARLSCLSRISRTFLVIILLYEGVVSLLKSFAAPSSTVYLHVILLLIERSLISFVLCRFIESLV